MKKLKEEKIMEKKIDDAVEEILSNDIIDTLHDDYLRSLNEVKRCPYE